MKIHIKSTYGLYTVEQYGRDTITLSTKHKVFQVPVDDFKSMAGGNWNHNIPQEQIDTFLSVVAPEYLAKQKALDAEIIALAKAIDKQDRERAAMKQALEESVATVYSDDEYEPTEPTKDEYERWWREESAKNYELNNKMRSIAYKVYSQKLDFSNLQIENGIKFIIQANHDETEYRFCWDPYGFVSNGHSDISSIFQRDKFYTVNGGWIKIIDNNVVLYFKSGDYGVYDDKIATECAKVLFPNKTIHSHAGLSWEQVEKAGYYYFDLPF